LRRDLESAPDVLEGSMIQQRITRRLVRTSEPPTDLRTPSGRLLPY
jgi:hypothetical protein